MKRDAIIDAILPSVPGIVLAISLLVLLLALSGCAEDKPESTIKPFESSDTALAAILDSYDIKSEAELVAVMTALGDRDQMKAEEVRRTEADRAEAQRKADADRAATRTSTIVGMFFTFGGGLVTVFGFWKVKDLIIPGLVALGIGAAMIFLSPLMHDPWVLWGIRIGVGGALACLAYVAWDHLITFPRYIRKRLVDLRNAVDHEQAVKIHGDIEGTCKLYGRAMPALT